MFRLLLQSIFIMADIGNLLKKDNIFNDYYDQSSQMDGQMFLIFVRISRSSLFFRVSTQNSRWFHVEASKKPPISNGKIQHIQLFFQIKENSCSLSFQRNESLQPASTRHAELSLPKISDATRTAKKRQRQRHPALVLDSIPELPAKFVEDFHQPMQQS